MALADVSFPRALVAMIMRLDFTVGKKGSH